MLLRHGSAGFALVLTLAACGGGDAGEEPLGFRVRTVAPASGANQVALATLVTATFSEAVAPATVTASAFTVTSTAGAVAGAVSLAGPTATFTPSALLLPATTYTASIAASVTTAGGTALPAAKTWSFTTVGGAAGWWVPSQGTTWAWELAAPPVAPYLPVAMYDIDLFDTPADTVAALQAQGSRVICYMSAGSYEPARPDSAAFPPAALGATLDGWPGERWLDVRSLELRTIMAARLDLCASKGFDGVEPDNVDGYANASGFPLSWADQLAYNRWLASAAHDRGLSVGLKNDLDQIPDLVASFDWALNEQCFEYEECDLLEPFTSDGKAVFNVEYGGSLSAICDTPGTGACARNFSSMKKTLALDAWREPCVCP